MLLTSSFVFPAIIAAAWPIVSGILSRNDLLASELDIGWKIAAGRSWRVNIGERTSYGLFRNCFAMASVTVNEAVGAQLPNRAS